MSSTVLGGGLFVLVLIGMLVMIARAGAGAPKSGRHRGNTAIGSSGVVDSPGSGDCGPGGDGGGSAGGGDGGGGGGC
ncbi:hypothetical protein [Saccharopolyspora griseoalba]|uniref:Uncharacterized protein n=1 Tax=Saccharopolyspora griseoalba TaxID=1431848 RepID=A0ABW2LJ45_9PSEU